MTPANVTNNDFLQACFGGAWGEAHVCGFEPDPYDLDMLGLRSAWMGGKVKNNPREVTFGGQNNYFTISTFRDGDDGKDRRRKSLFEATHVVVIDDVGTKVTQAEAETLPAPSWVLETSAGNYQWGYILATPERDAGRIDALLDGLVACGLSADGTDPGMKGVTRYVRLPVGTNTKAKYGPGGFTCRLDVWEPSRTYSVDEIANSRGVVLPAPGTVALKGMGRVKIAPDADEIYDLLARMGKIQGEAADGEGYQIECPWVGGHSGRSDTGAAYWMGGAFTCFHGHCDGKGRREIEAWADAEIRRESGGLVGLGVKTFPVVPGYQGLRKGGSGSGTGRPAAGAGHVWDFGTGATGAFFGELVYVAPEDAFFSVRTGEMLSRAAVDVVWRARMTKGNALSAAPGKSGALLKPSEEFTDERHVDRARIADKMTYWPGEARFFEEGGIWFANSWGPGSRLGVPVTDLDAKPWLDAVGRIAGVEGPGTVDVVLDWMALVVGAPGVKPGWHIFAHTSNHGTGKDWLIQPVRWAVGDSNVGSMNAKALGSDFNPWAEKRLVLGHELNQNTRGSTSGADQYNTLKELMDNTNRTIRINEKNRKAYYARNVSAFYITSNQEDGIALEQDDRRVLVLNGGDKVAGLTADEASAFAKWVLEDGGGDIVSEWLHQRWDGMSAARKQALMGRAPRTAGKTKMLAGLANPVETWIGEQIELGVWPDLMTSEDIGRAIQAAVKSGTAGFNFAPSPHKWAKILKSKGGDKVYRGDPVRLLDKTKARVWAVRSPSRFASMGETAIARAYTSAAGHSFSDDAKVISLKTATKIARVQVDVAAAQLDDAGL